MIRIPQARLWPVFASLAALAACSGPAVPDPEQMNASYEAALERTAPLAVELPGDGAVALAQVESFFRSMSVAAVREQAGLTYAPEAYLNDNIAIVQGAPAIGEYFARTLERLDGLQVVFLDVMHNGPEYFVRWRMTVTSPRFNDGVPMVSYGVTHFRFDERGRVLVHKDFWDAGTGLYEYVPGLRGVLRRLRAAAENG